MNDDRATAAARVRCAEFILAGVSGGPKSRPGLRTVGGTAQGVCTAGPNADLHGKPAYLEDPNRDPDFVPLAERLKAYVRRDQMQILPPR